MHRHGLPSAADMDLRDTQKVLLPGPPTPASRNPNVPNFSRILTIRAQTSHLPVKSKKTKQAIMRNPSKLSSVKRWDGQSHKSAGWDDLRRVSLMTCGLQYFVLIHLVGPRTLATGRRLPRPSIWSRKVKAGCLFQNFLQSGGGNGR